MIFPLYIAHGRGLITLMVVGFPAALIGIVCLLVMTFLAVKRREEDKKTIQWLGICGVGALALAFLSPVIGSLVGF